jgi:hypothetical protein
MTPHSTHFLGNVLNTVIALFTVFGARFERCRLRLCPCSAVGRSV